MKTFKFGESKIFLHQDDLPAKIKTPKIVAIDTETTGLSLIRDRLCLIQFAFSKEECHLVQFRKKDSKFDNGHSEVLKILNNQEFSGGRQLTCRTSGEGFRATDIPSYH